MKILMIVSGSIASQRTNSLVSILGIKHQITVCYTKESQKFFNVSEVIENKYVHKVYHPENKIDDSNIVTHIELIKQNDIVLVTPASFNFINKIRVGICDDLPSLLISVVDYKNLILCPAMNYKMLEKSNYIESIDYFFTRGSKIFNPIHGLLASGDFQKGQMVAPKTIVNYLDSAKIKLRKIIIISGIFSDSYAAIKMQCDAVVNSQIVEFLINQDYDIQYITNDSEDQNYSAYVKTKTIKNIKELQSYINALDLTKYDKIYMNSSLLESELLQIGEKCKQKIKSL